MNVKEMPGRVEKMPVVKGVFLGWLGDLPQGPGYACFVITHNHQAADETSEFQAHLMRAAGLDKPWKSVESRGALTGGAADALLAQHEKLAVWPEGNQE